ncbi:MAG: hypothetical protein M3Y56_02965 [Armatimonadota bacterium]|nr:hypothetical protein [Armatimonadota bacterium]
MTTALKPIRKSRIKDKQVPENVIEDVAARPAWEIVVELGGQISDEEWAKVPDDSSLNYRHYLYGTPKKIA